MHPTLGNIMTAKQIYRQWHEAAKSRNTAALLALGLRWRQLKLG